MVWRRCDLTNQEQDKRLRCWEWALHKPRVHGGCLEKERGLRLPKRKEVARIKMRWHVGGPPLLSGIWEFILAISLQDQLKHPTWSRPVVPNLFGTRDQFCGRQSFHESGQGIVWWWLKCIRALYFCYYYISCTSDHQALDQALVKRSWRLGIPGLEGICERCLMGNGWRTWDIYSENGSIWVSQKLLSIIWKEVKLQWMRILKHRSKDGAMNTLSENSREPQTCMHAKWLQLCLTLCDPMDYSPPGSSVHGDSPAKNIGVGCLTLLQGIFPTQGSNPHLLWLLHSRWILYHWRNPREPHGTNRKNSLTQRQRFQRKLELSTDRGSEYLKR